MRGVAYVLVAVSDWKGAVANAVVEEAIEWRLKEAWMDALKSHQQLTTHLEWVAIQQI